MPIKYEIEHIPAVVAKKVFRSRVEGELPPFPWDELKKTVEAGVVTISRAWDSTYGRIRTDSYSFPVDMLDMAIHLELARQELGFPTGGYTKVEQEEGGPITVK